MDDNNLKILEENFVIELFDKIYDIYEDIKKNYKIYGLCDNIKFLNLIRIIKKNIIFYEKEQDIDSMDESDLSDNNDLN